jgi:predicted DNA-binding antitoxin AbrB/MazE fold protein
MAQIIRAVYTNGILQPLDPVNFTEGEEVHLTLLSSDDAVMQALGDLLVVPIGPSDDEVNAIDEEALMKRIEEAFRGSDLSQRISLKNAVMAHDPLFSRYQRAS